jgi:hypothetical protein
MAQALCQRAHKLARIRNAVCGSAGASGSLHQALLFAAMFGYHANSSSTWDQTLMQAAMNGTAYRLALAIALLASLMLVWLSLGVGIIGADGDAANFMYFVVIVIGIAGAIWARLQPTGMAYTLFAMAIVQALIAAVALVAGLGQPYSGPLELMLLNGFFIAMFGISGWLFRVQHELNS